nr:MAG TPA: hypothetical protein [Caudoviricetes sp.]
MPNVTTSFFPIFKFFICTIPFSHFAGRLFSFTALYKKNSTISAERVP